MLQVTGNYMLLKKFLMDKRKLRKHVFNILKFVVSIGAVIYVLSKIDIERLGEAFIGVRWYLLFFAMLFFIGSKIVSSIRLNICFSNIEVRITQLSNFRLYLLSMFYNLFLPGGIGGDGYKIWYLKKEGGYSFKKLTAAVLHDRINGLFAIGLIVFLMLLFLSVPVSLKYISIVVLLVSVVTYLVILKRLFPWFYHSIVHVTFLSLIVQLFQVIAVISIALAIGINGQYPGIVLVFLVSSAVAVLPFTIGGTGARELVFLYGGKLLGIEVSLAVAISFIFFIITAVISFTGIYYSIKKTEVEFID